ncbi:transposase [Salmonella enterica]|nr:transposase [Salmonella enterica]EDW7675820.1 transposase [Salmonella enterica]EEN2802269.1 hypothetical protein [Salmonella enterica]EJZ1611759.1 IS66 family insertion sequence element accessory protein TnpB [Salmonella enterica]
MPGTSQSSWHKDAAFVFTNKARSRIKVLRRDKLGVWLCTPTQDFNTRPGLPLSPERAGCNRRVKMSSPETQYARISW